MGLVSSNRTMSVQYVPLPNPEPPLHNQEGKLVSKTARAATFAHFLAEKVWYLDTDSVVSVAAAAPVMPDMDSTFTARLNPAWLLRGCYDC